jgi:DNA-binding NarL/FixJ family response regulator
MSKPPPIKLLIVDDHPALRKGLREVEEINPQIKVVGEAGTGAEALKQATSLHPDVILLDYRLPDLSGHEICRSIRQKHPGVQVLFLSSYAAESTVRAAFDAGAAGYLLKENDAQKIVDAILTVAHGGRVVDPALANTLLVPSLAAGDTPAKKLGALSAQEAKVLQEVATGKTDKEIAEALGLQAKTIRNYLDHIFAKLGVHTRTQAAALYLRDKSDLDR